MKYSYPPNPLDKKHRFSWAHANAGAHENLCFLPTEIVSSCSSDWGRYLATEVSWVFVALGVAQLSVMWVMFVWNFEEQHLRLRVCQVCGIECSIVRQNTKCKTLCMHACMCVCVCLKERENCNSLLCDHTLLQPAGACHIWFIHLMFLNGVYRYTYQGSSLVFNFSGASMAASSFLRLQW